MNRVGCGDRRGGDVAIDRPPFRGTVPDTIMVDRERARLFASVGGTRGLFDGVDGWTDLNRLVAERSAALLSERGHDAWVEAGGAYDDEGGLPTLRARSPLGLAIVRDLAEGPGRLRWTDSSGHGWAARLVRRADADPGAYVGFAITWPGVPRPPGAGGPVDDVSAGGRHGDLIERDREQASPGRRLWFYQRAEQMLWVIHYEVLRQRHSEVLLPDVMMGQIVWGGERATWPGGWRRDLFRVLDSLSWLHAATLRLDDRSWRPRFGSHSVAVSHVEDRRIVGVGADACGPGCPMWATGEPHGHFFAQAGYGFLGVLERFVAADDGDGRRTFNFSRRPEGEAARELRAEERAGRLVTVSLTAKLFGPSAWSGLGTPMRGIVDGLMAEVTRGPKGRSDRAAVQVGDMVRGAGPRSRVACPWLRPGGRYVAFGGNGGRPGAGYRIAGAGGRGWLAKCGYPPPAEPAGWPRLARSFLADLGRVAALLDLTVVGLDPRDGSWLDLGRMRALAATGSGWPRLDSVHLRVYAPEGYLDRLRDHFASAGGFASIAGSDSGGPARIVGDGLAARMKLAGISQQRLAADLGVSQAFVSKVLSGKKPWPDGMEGRAEAFLGGVEAGR